MNASGRVSRPPGGPDSRGALSGAVDAARRSARTLRSLYLLIFLFLGAYGSYLSLWLDSHGWTDPDIGWMQGARQACVVLFPVAWGVFADRAGSALKPLRVMAIGATLCLAPLMLTHAFWPVLTAMVAFSAFHVGVIPTVDAIALTHVERHGGDYGRLRLFGSIGFIGGGLGLGGLIALGSLDVLPFALTALLAAFAGVAVFGLRGRTGTVAAPSTSGLTVIRRVLAIRPVRALYVVTFVSRVVGQGLFVFLPLHLADLGVSEPLMPVYWSLGVVSEILLLRHAERLVGGHRPRTVLGVCFVIGAVQFGITGLITSPLALLPVMLLHGVSFGLWYYTSIVYLGRYVPAEDRATAQALFQVSGFGLGGMLSSILSGYIFREGGGALLFGAAGAGMIGVAAFALWLLRADADTPSPTTEASP